MRLLQSLTSRRRQRHLLAASLVGLGALGVFAACKTTNSNQSALRDASVDPAFKGKGSFPIWAYDPGPDCPNPSDVNSGFGCALIENTAKIPHFGMMSKAVYGDQMFRPAFGPIPWRMMQRKNSVKILFIGQDGTHIAEAAERPATAGFGGRAQDLAKYFGVSSSAAFINTFAFTIRWQYGAFDTPFITNKTGTPKFSFGSFTGNQVWLISQDQDSPLVKWRNNMIDWIIRNNPDSLKMVVLFGGGARDAAGSFVVANGGAVGSRFTADQLKDVEVPEFELAGAGSNKQTSIPVDANGDDLLAQLSGGTPDYTKPAVVTKTHDDFAAQVNQDLAHPGALDDPSTLAGKMVWTHHGLNGSGMLDPAQLGGYDIARKMQVVQGGPMTISLNGMTLASGFKITHDILVTQLPHPTALSMMTPAAASTAVAKGLVAFDPFVKNGWRIDADEGFTNAFAAGQPYVYARADMGTEYYDFGAPNSRMVNVSTASRAGANVIVFGTRDRVNFDQATIKAMTNAKPSTMPDNNEMWVAKPNGDRRYQYDPGPCVRQANQSVLDCDIKYAKLMKTSLPTDQAFLAKHAINGDYGHYRGTFNDPQVLIFADPDGFDDLNTARALTGTRGQFLNGLMTDLGVGDKYLVIKTAPYEGVDADANAWNETVAQTTQSRYRDALLTQLMQDIHPKLILTDGATATAEFARIVQNPPCQCVVAIDRGASFADPTKKDAGIADALADIKKVQGFANATFSGKMVDIPRTHLSYYARVWEGTSGDRVITSADPKYRGVAFAEVAPQWAYGQKYQMPQADQQGTDGLIAKEDQLQLRHGGESVPDYMKRIASQQQTTPAAAAAAAVAAPTGGSGSSNDNSGDDGSGELQPNPQDPSAVPSGTVPDPNAQPSSTTPEPNAVPST